MRGSRLNRQTSTALLAIWLASDAFAQTYTVKTFAGGGLPVNIPAVSASIPNPDGIAVDAAGNVLIAVSSFDAVLRLDAKTGLLTLVAGNGTRGFSGDGGPAIEAQLNAPRDLAIDNSGNIYVADSNNCRIRKISNGTITTVAGADTGTSFCRFGGDNGPATSAFLSARAVAVDNAGVLYISDADSNRIRKVSGGVISTVAGVGDPVGDGIGDNGPATNAYLNFPGKVAFDAAGSMYIPSFLPHPKGFERHDHHRRGNRSLWGVRRRWASHQRGFECHRRRNR